ncbi:MAG: DUF4397 domain-containing protein [Trueperaceae bacterium]
MRYRFFLFSFIIFSTTLNALAQAVPPDVAAVRVAHVSPDAPMLDLMIDGTLSLRDIQYTTLSSYVLVPAGEHELRVQPHRTPNEETQTIEAPEPFILSERLEPGHYYTLVASGFFDPPPPQDELGSLQLQLSPGTTATVVGPRAYSETVTESTKLTELLPGTYTVTASREGFKTTAYEAEVRSNETSLLSINLQQAVDGIDPPAPEPVATPELTSTSGLEWRSVQLQLYEDELAIPLPGTALVRLIHASPTTPAVSLRVITRDNETRENAEETLFTELSYPNEANYVRVVSGQYTLEVYNPDNKEIMTTLENLEFQPGAIYTFFIVGTRSDNFISVIPNVEAILAGQP